MSTTNFDGKPRSNAYACKTTNVSSFSIATYRQYRHQKNLLQRSHKTSHRLCISSALKKNELPTSKGRQINLLGILNLPQQLTYNKGLFMHKVLNNNSPNYLAQHFTSHQSHYTNSRNKTSTCQCQDLTCPSGNPCLKT